MELTRYLYRITNLNGQVPSAPSAPSAVVNTPLAAPSYVYAYYDSYSGGMTVYWNATYGTNRTSKLEWAESDASGMPTRVCFQSRSQVRTQALATMAL